MATSLPVFGVTENDDLREDWVRRDTRPFLLKHASSIGGASPFIMAAWAIVVLMVPAYCDWLFVLGLIIRGFIGSQLPRFPYSELMRKKHAFSDEIIGDGFMVIGTDRETGHLLVKSSDMAKQHELLLGTTGSGKTRTILSSIYSGALLWSSGVLLVDGKGDSLTFWLIYRLCRRLDRTDDLLIMNFINGGRESGSTVSPVTRTSNTNNSWASSVSDMITEMLAGMMPSGGGDGEYWRGRAQTMVGALIRILVVLRDRGEIVLDVQTLRENMTLAKLMTLVKRPELTVHQKAGLLAYLYDLGISEQEVELYGTENQLDFAPKVIEQHGYLQQQLTSALGMLGDTYRHIFGVRFGEIDWGSVVYSRKIVFVLLPALEKSPDSIVSLARLILAGLKSALSPALGSVVEGSYGWVMSKKIADQKTPYFIYFDEWGAYAIEGAQLFVTQLRGLGIAVCFSSQDSPSMGGKTEVTKQESKSIIGSTNCKICMRIEEMEETYKVFESGAGKARVSIKTGDKFNAASVTGGYYNEGSTNLEERSRVNSRDLKDQDPGDAHVMIRDKLVRAKLLYVTPPEVEYARINQWMDILPATDMELKQHCAANSGKLFNSEGLGNRKARHTNLCPSMNSDAIAHLFKAYEEGLLATDGNVIESTVCAIGSVVLKNKALEEELRARIDESRPDITSAPTSPAKPTNSAKTNAQVTESQPTERITAEAEVEATTDPITGQDTAITAAHIEDDSDKELMHRAEEKQAFFTNVLQGSISTVLKDIDGVTPDEKQYLNVEGQLRRSQVLIDLEDGMDPDDDIRSSMLTLTDSMPEHPPTPTPDAISKEELQMSIVELIDSLD